MLHFCITRLTCLCKNRSRHLSFTKFFPFSNESFCQSNFHFNNSHFGWIQVEEFIHIANDLFHAPFLLVFALCYVDEPIRYVIMQVHMYSRKWIKPVSDEGRATIDAFRRKYNVRVKGSGER